MKKNLSTLVVLILFYSRAFAVGIDSVWVKEETICNDSNIVSICYILRDGPTRISVSVSDNDGMSWGVPLNTLFDASGDIGDSISSGTHCFYWLMSNDYPGHERRDWLVRIQARSSFIDTFSFLDTTRYMINGNDGYVDVANGYFVLTTPNNDRNGRIMSVDSVYTDTLYVSFDFRMWERGGIIDPLGYQGADGISFILSRYLNPPLALGGAIGIRYTGGIGVGIDNWYNGSPCDMNSNHIEISIDADCGGTGLPTPLYQTDIPFELIDGNWHHVEISILGQHWVVLVDGVTYFDVVLSPTQ
ncbi:MAG: lectin-like domain-containing protein, partial [bacterium]